MFLCLFVSVCVAFMGAPFVTQLYWKGTIKCSAFDTFWNVVILIYSEQYENNWIGFELPVQSIVAFYTSIKKMSYNAYTFFSQNPTHYIDVAKIQAKHPLCVVIVWHKKLHHRNPSFNQL